MLVSAQLSKGFWDPLCASAPESPGLKSRHVGKCHKWMQTWWSWSRPNQVEMIWNANFLVPPDLGVLDWSRSPQSRPILRHRMVRMQPCRTHVFIGLRQPPRPCRWYNKESQMAWATCNGKQIPDHIACINSVTSSSYLSGEEKFNIWG